MANGIDLLLADHRRVDDLFGRFAQTADGSFVGQIADALHAHDDAEQAALYPLVGRVLGDADTVERAANAHSAVKKQLERLMGLEGQPLVEAVAVLQQLVQEHVQDEEQQILPALAERATSEQLEALHAKLLQAKQRGG